MTSTSVVSRLDAPVKVVAGIGVSGAQDFEDIECARTALEAAGFGRQVS